jgi:hypothetical protein
MNLDESTRCYEVKITQIANNFFNQQFLCIRMKFYAKLVSWNLHIKYFII